MRLTCARSHIAARSSPTSNTHYSDAEIAAALEAFAQEPVHIPGAIQPVGCLVSLDADIGRIRQVSANIEDFLGISVADAQAGAPETVLGDEWMDLLKTEAIKQDNSASVLTATAQSDVPEKRRRFHVVTYPSGDAFVVELELLMRPEGNHLLDTINDWLVEVGKIDG